VSQRDAPLALGPEVLLAEPRGFCAGVDRAIQIVEHALVKFGAPVYVRHEIVHNTYVVESLKRKGAIFIEDLAEVPAGAIVIFSAHGVSRAVEEEAERRGLRVFDATCPLVKKVHVEVAKRREEGYEFILIGHRRHPEVEGTLGQVPRGAIHLVETMEDVARLAPAQTERLAVVTQTTLSVDDAADILRAIRARFPNIREPKQQDICYATQNRQDAVKMLSRKVDVMVVIGSRTSSNTNRLREVAQRLGVETHMIDSADELRPEWFAGRERIGVTAGASAPEVLVQQVLARLAELGVASVQRLKGVRETMKFPMPKGLKLDPDAEANLTHLS
jgi:4-hydroxy-3-methylbut-2-enyl diphosphate reductase